MRLLLIFSLFLGINVNAQQMAFNYVEITAEENAQSKIVDLFDDNMEGKSRKSGGIFLERLRHGGENGRTHRIVWLRELDNAGFVEEADKTQSSAFWRGLRTLVEDWGEARAGRILNIQFGDEVKNPYLHIWDVKANDEAAYVKAQNMLIKETGDEFKDRIVGFGTYDVNMPNGASHWFLVSGEDINDHLSLYDRLRRKHGKAFSKYFETRGDVELVQDFVVQRLKTYQ